MTINYKFQVYLEAKSPRSLEQKFWSVSVSETAKGDYSLVTRWGRAGTKGQAKSWVFDRPDLALEAAREKALAKIDKGYLQLQPPVGFFDQHLERMASETPAPQKRRSSSKSSVTKPFHRPKMVL